MIILWDDFVLFQAGLTPTKFDGQVLYNNLVTSIYITEILVVYFIIYNLQINQPLVHLKKEKHGFMIMQIYPFE